MDTAKLSTHVKQTFKNNQPSILSTIGNAVKKAFGHLIDVAFGGTIVQDANADKLGFFRSLRNRRLSVNLSDASKVQGTDRMLIGNSKYLQYFCNTAKAMADMPGTDVVVVNAKEGINQLSHDGGDQYTDAPATYKEEEVQFLTEDKANYFELPETCKLAHWNLLSMDPYTQEGISSTEHTIAGFILDFFDSIEKNLKDFDSKELTLAVQMPIFKPEAHQESSELTEIFLDYFELARMEFAKKLGKKITIKLYRNPEIADKDLHDKNLTDISKSLNKKRNNPSTKNAEVINHRLAVIALSSGSDSSDVNEHSQTDSDEYYDAVTPSTSATNQHASNNDNPIHGLKLDKYYSMQDLEFFSVVNTLQIPNLTKSKIRRISKTNGTNVMTFGISFYQNNDASLQEQLSDGSDIKVKTFDCADNVKDIEATDDVINSITEKAIEALFTEMFTERTEFEIKLPSFNQMKGKTYIQKYFNLLNFAIKLNSSLQYRLAALTVSNNDKFKNDKDEYIGFCKARAGLVFTLDKDTIQYIKTTIFMDSPITDTDILNSLVSEVSLRTP